MQWCCSFQQQTVNLTAAFQCRMEDLAVAYRKRLLVKRTHYKSLAYADTKAICITCRARMHTLPPSHFDCTSVVTAKPAKAAGTQGYHHSNPLCVLVPAFSTTPRREHSVLKESGKPIFGTSRDQTSQARVQLLLLGELA